jgi:hypothetical protein
MKEDIKHTYTKDIILALLYVSGCLLYVYLFVKLIKYFWNL